MTLVAFDTATRATSVALALPGAEPQEARDDPPAGARPRHATHMLPLAEELLRENGLRWEDVQQLAVGVGPGTFTGLRIGLASARALAQALDIPLTGVSTAASLALGAWPQALAARAALVVAVIDARRGEVFAAAWPTDPAAGDPAAILAAAERAVLAPRAMAPAELAAWLRERGEAALLAGDGAVAFRHDLEGDEIVVPADDAGLHRVCTRHHCLLAAHLPARPPGDVTPEYLRAPDAALPGTRTP